MGMQGKAGDAGRCRGDAGGCSGAKPAAVKPAAAKGKADYSRPRQTMVEQSIVILAVLPAPTKHFNFAQLLF